MGAPYIAKTPIFFGTSRGYNPGDIVPDDVVKQHNLEDQVAREDTKAADAALAVTTSQEG